jgi:hypothetical protein
MIDKKTKNPKQIPLIVHKIKYIHSTTRVIVCFNNLKQKRKRTKN